MRFRSLRLSLLLLALFPPLFAQEVFTVPIIDKTEAGSPFDVVTAQATLTETLQGNQLISAWGDRLSLKNISGKAILLYVVRLQLIGRHNHGLRQGPGDGPTYFLTDDRFFNPSLIRPGETVVVRDSKPGTGQVQCCVNPLEPASNPQAEFAVTFVQFQDGSHFGDPSNVKDELAIRAAILGGLRGLVTAYARNGPRAFENEAQQQAPWHNTSIFGQILGRYKQAGAESAIALARETLAVAESHEVAGAQLGTA